MAHLDRAPYFDIDLLEDRSGPPIVDKETGRCRKCWHEPEEISR